jgi:hypothetical protein
MPFGTRTTDIWRNRILVSAITDACWMGGADFSALRETMDCLLARMYSEAPCLTDVLRQMVNHEAQAGKGREDQMRRVARRRFAIEVMASGRVLTATDEALVKALLTGPTTLAS